VMLTVLTAVFISGAAFAHDGHGGGGHGGGGHGGHDGGHGGYYGGHGYGDGYYPALYAAPFVLYFGAEAASHSYPSSSSSYSSAPAHPTAAQTLAMHVQVQLNSAGYYQGAIDGDIGPATRAALSAYQKDHGLSQTGDINDATLKSLGVTN